VLGEMTELVDTALIEWVSEVISELVEDKR
ncbi:MAG: hypothetical protein RL448_704, partial [Actinomycetota bacterium]